MSFWFTLLLVLLALFQDCGEFIDGWVEAVKETLKGTERPFLLFSATGRGLRKWAFAPPTVSERQFYPAGKI